MLKVSGVDINNDKSVLQNLSEGMPQSLKDNKNLGNSIDVELEQNTSGDILNVTLSDDGILQDEPSKTLVTPIHKTNENNHSNNANSEMLEDVSHKGNIQHDVRENMDKEENIEDAKFLGGGDSFIPKNSNVKKNVITEEENKPANHVASDISHELMVKNGEKDINKDEVEASVESSDMAETQEEYAQGEQQYAEQQQWDENAAAQYYQQDGQYYQYGDEVYQQEYGEGEYNQQYTEEEYNQQYGQGEYDQQYAEYNQQYTEQEYQEYQQQQQNQNKDGNEQDFQQTEQYEQQQHISEEQMQQYEEQGENDEQTQQRQSEQYTEQKYQEYQQQQDQNKDGNKQDFQQTQLHDQQHISGEQIQQHVEQGLNDDQTQQRQSEQYEKQVEHLEDQGQEGGLQIQNTDVANTEEISESQTDKPERSETLQANESNELNRTESQQKESNNGMVMVQQTDGCDLESIREVVPQQPEMSTDVSEPSVSSEKVEEYRQLLGVPAVGEPETSDTDELEAQLAALVDTKHDGSKQKDEFPLTEPVVQPVAEDMTSSESKPEQITDAKPIVTPKPSKLVSKKLPDLQKVLESDSESLQLDATVSNAESDDFDFSSEK
ncbi:hypothetical protein L9F63_006155 [Diploptera punctata]|uniref:Uncharacterized protein n=1 Tax=Diploptera punctata TaxID=6984 RepID=A0AAD8E592_DIPPU|nr:hypothetical protein L9F63_006155 [Diploptera punctata]